MGVVDADARRSASDVMDAQGDVARAGCAGTVIGSPWWNVYAPTISISYQCSAGACVSATQDSWRAGVEWRAHLPGDAVALVQRARGIAAGYFHAQPWTLADAHDPSLHARM